MESCVGSFIRPRYRILPPEFYTLLERCKPVGDVGIELYAWFRPVVGVVIGAGLAVAASPEELPSDEEVSPSPQRAVNGWAWMASTRQARAAW